MSSTARTSSASVGPKQPVRLPGSSPAFVGAIAGIVLGVVMVGYGAILMGGEATGLTLNVALIIFGLAEAVSSFYCLQRMRVAWAFTLSLNGTGFVVMLFSAPRIRDAADISIAWALAPCIVFFVIVLLQSLRPDDF